MNPTVLIATTRRWYPTARLGMALANAGCVVHSVCPSGHPLSTTGALQQMHTYSGLRPLKSFQAAIEATQPNFIVPGDDLATDHLHQLHSELRQRNAADSVCDLIERSLGASVGFPVVYARTEFIKLAGQIGIRVPDTEIVQNVVGLKRWIERAGLPTVLKTNGSSGGDGVRIVRTWCEAENAFRRLQAPPLLARAAKRALIDRDFTLVWPSVMRHRHTVNAQVFVTGREATSTVVCRDGSVLASLHFEVVKKVHARGHATVVRVIKNAEMSTAVEKIVRRLSLSGLHGFDFMIESDTGDAFLIEMNPRATQVGHLSLGRGRDLPAALSALLSGEARRVTPKVTENDTIALFPQEWLRDPGSRFLKSAYHDVPWEEPALVGDCLRKGRKQDVARSKDWLPVPSGIIPQPYAPPSFDYEME